MKKLAILAALCAASLAIPAHAQQRMPPQSVQAGDLVSLPSGDRVLIPRIACTDAANNRVSCSSSTTTGQQTSASSQSVTPASDSDFASKANQTNGNQLVRIGTAATVFDGGNAVQMAASSVDQVSRLLGSVGYYYDGTTIRYARGDTTGEWVHGPASTPVALGGNVASGATIAIPFVSTADQEVVNPSTATFWCSWATPAANAAGSYPLPSFARFTPPNRPAGTFTCLNSSGAAAAITATRY